MKLFPHTVSARDVSRQNRKSPVRTYRYVETTAKQKMVSVLKHPVASFTGRCKQCHRVVLKFTPEAAAAMAGTTPHEIYRLMEIAGLHFTELSSGKVFICSESLKNALPKELP
ncbi:hypothetical protein [Granulicella sp. S156]|uniref:hypothetical protein n=1 Tax=Granulicella sp. S156 TaxID=1747224 RepID=UPI00131AE787|nr:hypothetical protein [Granulicella sp. S156]